MTLFDIQKECYKISKSKGWWENSINIPEKLALINSEVSEALEAYRKYDDENLAEELADVAIRTMDLAAHLGINLEDQILRKNQKNSEREYRHGGKRC